MGSEFNIDEVSSSTPRLSPCNDAALAGSVLVGQAVVVKDHLGRDVPLRPRAFCIIATDAAGRSVLVDGSFERPWNFNPAEIPDGANCEILVLYKKSAKASPEVRRAGQLFIEAIAENHVESLIETAIQERITESISGEITNLIEQKIAAAGAAQYQVGDWKMRLDGEVQQHWFRSGERFARQIYPALYELLGTDTVPDFRGRIMRQLIPGINDPGSFGALCPGEGCTGDEEIGWVNVDFLIYGGLPASCEEIAES